jgi:hypothetical protein
LLLNSSAKETPVGTAQRIKDQQSEGGRMSARKITLEERQALPTTKQIHAAKTKRGGWTRATLAQWGVPWPPRHGWQKTISKMRNGEMDRPHGWSSPVIVRSLRDEQSPDDDA